MEFEITRVDCTSNGKNLLPLGANYFRLTLSTLGIFLLAGDILNFFQRKTDFDISVDTICMKFHIPFSGKKKKNINLPSAELAKQVVKDKLDPFSKGT